MTTPAFKRQNEADPASLALREALEALDRACQISSAFYVTLPGGGMIYRGDLMRIAEILRALLSTPSPLSGCQMPDELRARLEKLPDAVRDDLVEVYGRDDDLGPVKEIASYVREVVAMHVRTIEMHLRHALAAAPPPQPDACPVCGGDCGSANPPVLHCPMRPDALTQAEER